MFGIKHSDALVEQGQATDIQIQAEEIIKLKKQINQLYVKHTGQPLDVIGELWHSSNVTQLTIFTHVFGFLIFPDSMRLKNLFSTLYLVEIVILYQLKRAFSWCNFSMEML